MTTVESTQEKNFKTLTGNECIPLSDKTHIKASLLMQLKTQLDSVQSQVDSVMYRHEYALATVNDEEVAEATGTISFTDTSSDGTTFIWSGTMTVTVPHTARYYVSITGLQAVVDSVTFSYGDNNYAIGQSKTNLTILTDGELSIKFATTGQLTIDSLRITESAVELPSNKTYVDSSNCLVLDV